MSENYPNPKKGERWKSVSPRHGICRVMADPIEGYVMARYKGAVPFLVGVSCWHIMFEPVDPVTSAQKAESK